MGKTASFPRKRESRSLKLLLSPTNWMPASAGMTNCDKVSEGRRGVGWKRIKGKRRNIYEQGEKMMFRNLTIVVLGFLLFGLMGCEPKTPEIRGVVLDEETKQPVEAWVHGTLQLKTKTIQGDVQTVLRGEPG